MRLKDKVAIITGASRGIGRAMALLFAQEGAKIVVNYSTSKEEALTVVDEINARGGRKAIAIQCDVSQETEVESMIQETMSTFGRIDILVNNAGIVFDVPFFERTVEQWKKTLDVNLLGTFLCSRSASRHMLKSGGKIINISSTNAIDSFSPEAMDYDASKAGIVILTRDLAKQLAPNIQVNSIAPGWVDTDMNKELPKEFVEEETDKIYMKRFARPEEIAKVALFFASDDANYVTGSTLKVDGGYG